MCEVQTDCDHKDSNCEHMMLIIMMTINGRQQYSGSVDHNSSSLGTHSLSEFLLVEFLFLFIRNVFVRCCG